jgi:hypothetical protein
MSDKTSAVRVAAAVVAGIVGALVGVLRLGARRTDGVHLDPEHPLYGR